MRRFAACLVLFFCIALVAGPVAGAPRDDAGPSAVQVVVRGKKNLVDAIETAAQPAWVAGHTDPVLFVVDVTPPTQKAKAKIAAALTALQERAKDVPEWSIAALGEKPAKPVPTAGALGALLDGVLAKETDVVSTLTCLRRTLKAWKAKSGVVVYLADWHFEDDVDLEDFIKDLEKKGRVLSVVGTEAAFGRAWNDGFRDLGERVDHTQGRISIEDYWKNVGRDPFGNRDTTAPWHGGDTAYPVAPYRWDRGLWQSAFSQSDWDLADLDDDIEDATDSALRGSPFMRLIELRIALSSVQRQLDEAEPGSAQAKHYEERKRAIEAEIAEVERQTSIPEVSAADPDDKDEVDAELQALEKQRADLGAEQDRVLEKLLATDDPEETKRLREEHARLSTEAGRLESEIASRQAELDAEREAKLDAELEELKRRLPGGSTEPEEEDPPWVDPTVDKYRDFALPSTFGPYGLMRAAGVSGGRYVLWSWNPSGRKNVVLEYSRCNLFPPDLRSRKAIRADLKKNPWAASLIRAWWSILDARTEVVAHTPPLRSNLRSPAVMMRTDGVGSLIGIWDTPAEQKQYEKYAERSIEALDRAIALVDEGLKKGGEPQTPVMRRYQAEALRFRHAARMARFELAESVAASKLIDRRAWRDHQRHGVVGHTWVGEGRNPERVRASAGVLPFDAAAGEPLIEERKALLGRFRGTPFGEEIALNDIDTARPTDWERVDKIPGTGRSPSESVDLPKPTPKPPGGGSSGGGPTTGGD